MASIYRAKIGAMNFIAKTYIERRTLKIVRGFIKTNVVGSKCLFEFEVDDDASPDEIEEEAKEVAFSYMDWSYEVTEE